MHAALTDARKLSDTGSFRDHQTDSFSLEPSSAWSSTKPSPVRPLKSMNSPRTVRSRVASGLGKNTGRSRFPSRTQRLGLFICRVSDGTALFAVHLPERQSVSVCRAFPGRHSLMIGCEEFARERVRLKPDTTDVCRWVTAMFCGAGCGYSKTRSPQAERRRHLPHSDTSRSG